MSHEPYIRTISGRRVYLRDPALNAELHLSDFAHALARVARFTGHTNRPYSVAAHCLMVHDLTASEYRPGALLHDVAEAVLGDVSSPLKSMLPDYREIEASWNAALQARLGPQWEGVDAIKVADRMAFAIERRDLCPYDSSDMPAYWDIETKVSIPESAPVVGKYLLGPETTGNMWLHLALAYGAPAIF